MNRIRHEIQRLQRAFSYSQDGLLAAWRDEPAFRLEAVAAAVLIPLALFVAPGTAELALMVGSIFLVLIVELVNTAIEAAIDRHGEEIHPLSKKTKDCGSAAVLLACFAVLFTWVICLS